MRNLKLTHEEIYKIELGLDSSYRNILRALNDNSLLLSKEAREEMLKVANEFDELRAEIRNGDKDF
jgi:hypothetical protein